MVSIILPTYNGEKYIRKSIQSIIDQTYTDWELIIIDDCSTDSTNDIATEYIKKDKRIKLFRNSKNLKLPASLNAGFSYAQGNYLTWTSDDNLLKPDSLKIFVDIIQNNRNYGLFFSRMEYIDANGKSIGFSHAPTTEKELYYHNIIGASFMYTREVYEKIGNYNTEKFLMEDYDYWLRITKIYPVKYIPEVLYQYRQHERSLTETRNKQVLEGKVKLLEEQLASNIFDSTVLRMIYKELAEALFSLDRYAEMKLYYKKLKKISPQTADVRKAVHISCIIGPSLSAVVKKVLKKKTGIKERA